MEWYYAKHGRQEGPIDDATLRTWLAGGAIARTNLVWREGMAEWTPAGELAELSGLGGGTGPPRQETLGAPQPGPAPPGGLAPYSGASLTGQAGSPPVPPGVMMMAPVPPTSGLAIASMTCGILGVLVTMGCLMGGIFGLPAVICGHSALRAIHTSLMPIGGRGMAIAGLVTGYLACLGTLALVVVVMIGGFGGSAPSIP